MSQRLIIRRELLAGKKISALSALRCFGCMRLASRILELRKTMEIADEWRQQGEKRYKVYFVPDAVQSPRGGRKKTDSKAPPRPRGRPKGSRDVRKRKRKKKFKKELLKNE